METATHMYYEKYKTSQETIFECRNVNKCSKGYNRTVVYVRLLI